jgi:hypothetical protein
MVSLPEREREGGRRGEEGEWLSALLPSSMCVLLLAEIGEGGGGEGEEEGRSCMSGSVLYSLLLCSCYSLS